MGTYFKKRKVFTLVIFWSCQKRAWEQFRLNLKINLEISPEKEMSYKTQLATPFIACM